MDRGVCRYECPADFVPLNYSHSEKYGLENENTELWLIKAPAGFNPSSLENVNVSLSGLEMIQSTDASPHIYSILSSRSAPTDLHLITSGGKEKGMCSFAGILSISESYGVCNENQSPMPIPAAPAPSLPSGLKQRFQPFGNSTVAHTVCDNASSSVLPLKKVKLETEIQSKKKKKKKKEKRGREETHEVGHFKQEEMSYEYGDLQVPQPLDKDSTVRKKKKIKKECDREETLNEVNIDTSLLAKQEPMDMCTGDIVNSGKMKKKKKKKAQD